MYLFGASGHAKVIFEIVKAIGLHVDGVFDDNEHARSLFDIKVEHIWRGESPMIICVGNNRVRKSIAMRLNCAFSKAVHPSSMVSASVTIGDGSVVMAGAIINAESHVGKHCIVNTGASIDHDCEIDDYVHISPHATLCGNVQVGEGSWIGAGSTVIQGIKIGKWCTIGAGSVIIRDVPDGATVVGVPAKEIKAKV